MANMDEQNMDEQNPWYGSLRNNIPLVFVDFIGEFQVCVWSMC